MKHLMSGNEATARGVYEAGIKVCSAYPGTPSTEILENLPQYGEDVYCEWAPNEKVAAEMTYGASLGGISALLSMLNSCASGTSVVNIDNGFGAGFLAGRINQMESAKE